MKFPAYPKYKSSGVDWIGSIPEHWEIRSLTRLTLSIRNGTSATQLDDAENTVPVTRIESISGGRISFDKVGQVEWTPAVESFRLKKGDILLSHINSLSMVGNCALMVSDVPLYSGMNLLRIQPEPTVYAPWLWRAISSDGIRKEISSKAKPAINQASVTTTQIKSLQLPVPPHAEQRAIAEFLDRETGRIDRLVAKKRELIERLKEKRTALISRTVTRGLPPAAARAAGLSLNPPLKPSGLDWLGDIPVHWEVKRLKVVSPYITVGIVVEPSKYYIDEGVPCPRSLNVKPHRLTESDLVFISPESNELHSKSKIYEGDLVAVRSGQPGTTAIVDHRFHGANCIDLIIIRKPHAATSSFLDYFLNSDLAKAQFETGTGGAIQQHFNISTAASLQIITPPLPEQTAIAAYLDTETAKLDALVAKVETAIERLQEYRTALITAAVTGKIDVRNSVARAEDNQVCSGTV